MSENIVSCDNCSCKISEVKREKYMKPTPEEIRNARLSAGLTHRECAELIYIKTRGWQAYEAGERSMHEAFWELFNIKVQLYKRPEKKKKNC